jgi:hypothetical protein
VWRSFVRAGGSWCQSFDSSWWFFSAKCSSSISAKFLIYGAHTVCFCPLVAILDPLSDGNLFEVKSSKLQENMRHLIAKLTLCKLILISLKIIVYHLWYVTICCVFFSGGSNDHVFWLTPFDWTCWCPKAHICKWLDLLILLVMQCSKLL